MSDTLRDFETDWLKVVDHNLRLLGYKHSELDKTAWKQLYNEGLSPFQAINQSEFDGNITFFQMRQLQNFKY